MSTEQTVDTTDDLDAFSAEFFGQKEAHVEATTGTENEVEDAPNTEDTQTGIDTPETEDVETQEESAEHVEEPKKKNRFQERIDDLTGKARAAERERDALQDKLDQILARLDKTEAPTPPTKTSGDVEPSPTDLNEDGTEKYPYGEFDARYISDLTRYSLRQEFLAAQAKTEAAKAKSAEEQAHNELRTGWNEKLETAQERYPDFREKGENLIATFSGIDQAYGDYLSTTIMGMEFGPDVLYYLSNHPDVAKQIVNSGAAKATVALGRLEAKFADEAEEKSKAKPRVSQAPTPPPVNKGAAVSAPTISADTDDLDAFASIFFKKR